MGIVATDVFVQELVGAPDGSNLRLEVATMMGESPLRQRLRNAGKIDEASARECYNLIKAYVKNRGWMPGKMLRPWELDKSLYAKLDRAQPWWGFEFETGYRSANARAEVIEHVWDTWDNVVFDSEGEGNAAVEITFAPRPMSEYLDFTADACQFVAYLDGNERVMKTNDNAVGCHINMSHPSLGSYQDNVVYSLNRTLAAMPLKNEETMDVRLKMFGRSALYGGCFQRYDPQDQEMTWIEGKLFRTTYSTEQFKTYVAVCEGLNKCLELFLSTVIKNNDGGKVTYAYVDNLYEIVFKGAEPVVKWDIHRGNLDGIRGGGMINGPLASDQIKIGEDGVEPYMLAAVVEDDYDAYGDDDDDDAAGDWCEDCNCYH